MSKRTSQLERAILALETSLINLHRDHNARVNGLECALGEMRKQQAAKPARAKKPKAAVVS